MKKAKQADVVDSDGSGSEGQGRPGHVRSGKNPLGQQGQALQKLCGRSELGAYKERKRLRSLTSKGDDHEAGEVRQGDQQGPAHAGQDRAQTSLSVKSSNRVPESVAWLNLSYIYRIKT